MSIYWRIGKHFNQQMSISKNTHILSTRKHDCLFLLFPLFSLGWECFIQVFSSVTLGKMKMRKFLFFFDFSGTYLNVIELLSLALHM